MERYEMTELLSKKAGVSLEQARAALEANDWDLLDAMIALDRAHRAQTDRAEADTAGSGGDSPVRPVKSVSGGKGGGAAAAGFATVWKYVKKLLRVTMDNYFIVVRRGREILSVPVLVMIVLFFASFGLMLLALVVGLFCECRYRFEGRQLGRDGVNGAMGKMSDAAEDIKDVFRGGHDQNG